MVCPSRRSYAYVTRSGTNELILFVLLNGLPHPTSRPPQGKQAERRAIGQLGRVCQGDQSQINCWQLASGFGHHLYQFLHEGNGRFPTKNLLRQAQQQPGSWIACRVQRMAKTGNALTTPQPRRYGRTHPRHRTSLAYQRGNTLRVATV